MEGASKEYGGGGEDNKKMLSVVKMLRSKVLGLGLR